MRLAMRFEVRLALRLSMRLAERLEARLAARLAAKLTGDRIRSKTTAKISSRLRVVCFIWWVTVCVTHAREFRALQVCRLVNKLRNIVSGFQWLGYRSVTNDCYMVRQKVSLSVSVDETFQNSSKVSVFPVNRIGIGMKKVIHWSWLFQEVLLQHLDNEESQIEIQIEIPNESP